MRRHRRSVVLAATCLVSTALVPPARPRAPKLQATATKELDLQERKAQSPVEELGDDMCLIPGEVVVRVVSGTIFEFFCHGSGPGVADGVAARVSSVAREHGCGEGGRGRAARDGDRAPHRLRGVQMHSVSCAMLT